MKPLLVLSAVALVLFLPPTAGSVSAANQVFKCVINGSVTFQSNPCPNSKLSNHPTKEELNADRKKRLATVEAKAVVPRPGTPSARSEPASPVPTPVRESGYRCDGRQYCSQMRSCAEAKYFLANCPGAKMDGNRDGIPCEQQWCTHPFAE